MSAYLLAFVRTHNEEAMNRDYMMQAHAIVSKHGGKALVVNENVRAIEGKLPEGRMVIVEFPSMENAEAFYADPDYQPLIETRKMYSDSDAIIFDKGLLAES